MDSASGLYNVIIGQSETQYYDEEGTPIYDSNPVVQDAWATAVEASQAGLTAKLTQFDETWNQGFAKGSFATIACPAWMIGYIKGQAGDAGDGLWDVADIPGEGGNWGGSYLAIPAASENQEAAYELIKWLTAPEQQVKMWTDSQHFPSSSTAAEDAAIASATDSYFFDAPIGEIFKASADDLPIAILGPKDGVIKDTISAGSTGSTSRAKTRTRPGSRRWTRSRAQSDERGRDAVAHPLPRRPRDPRSGPPAALPWEDELEVPPWPLQLQAKPSSGPFRHSAARGRHA